MDYKCVKTHTNYREHQMTEQQNAVSEDDIAGGRGLAIAALVLGIMAFFPGCCASGFYGQYILALLAIIFGAMSLSGPAAGLAKAGLTLGIIAIVLWIALTILGVAAGDRMMEWVKQQQQQQQEQGESSGSGDFNNDFNNDGDNFDGDGDTGQNDGGTSEPATTGN